MKYLFIDFGASFVKTILYDSVLQEYKIIKELENLKSPFQENDSIQKIKLQQFLNEIVSKIKDIDGIVICTIKGGGWVDDIYYSWKSKNIENKEHCLISGLFVDSPTYHMHAHHGGIIQKIIPLGKIKNITIYSSLGDTDCVIESLDLKDNEIAINIGTGSQVIFKENSSIKTIPFIPAGRALMCFNNFFAKINFDFFSELQKIKPQQVYSSTMNIDLNVFSQSKHFLNGGSINNIVEKEFTIDNLLSSILRCLVIQYSEYIPKNKKILLVGGIPKKLPILNELFEYYYQDNEISIKKSQNISDTHRGMTKIIQKYL
jgi:hypothetical protein